LKYATLGTTNLGLVFLFSHQDVFEPGWILTPESLGYAESHLTIDKDKKMGRH